MPCWPQRALPGFDRLQAWLADRVGVDPAMWTRDIRPHITLGFGGPRAPTIGIEPISYAADRLLLVESVVGQRRRIVHAQWPLAA